VLELFHSGQIEIELPKISYELCEDVEGKVSITLKKPTKSRSFKIILWGYEIVTHESKHGKTSKSQRTVYLKEQVLTTEVEYSADEKFVYPFKLPGASEQDLPGYLPPGDYSGIIGKIKTFWANASRQSPIYWRVKATLDVLGFDLNKEITIYVDRSPKTR
jgi:hypothetical protein